MGIVRGLAWTSVGGDTLQIEVNTMPGKGELMPVSYTHLYVYKRQGEECEVNVTFPEEYHADELKGKPATFKVTVKEIKVKELPELNDEFASEVSDFDTMDEYKADVRAKLEERKAKEATTLNEDRVIEKVVENASMEIPDPMLESQCRNMLEDYARRLESQGLAFDQYMKLSLIHISKSRWRW